MSKKEARARDAERRQPEGREGAGAQQEGPHSQQAGQPNRRAPGEPQKQESNRRSTAEDSPRDAGGTWPEDEGETKTRQGTGDTGPHHAGQKTVQGKNERGPRTDEAKGEDGNEGSRGQNIDPRRQKDEHTGKKYTH